MSDHIFVFGSNLAGIHGAGAAWHAKKYHRAQEGIGRGLTGTSYAIPTKDNSLRSRKLEDIAIDVQAFLNFAWAHRDMTFDVTRVGCGLAGFRDEQIAPMFSGAPYNCILPHGWRDEYK